MNMNVRSKMPLKVGFRDSVKYVSLAIIFMFGVYGMASTRPPDGVEVKKPFTLAYIDTNWKLCIRWSQDGTNWSSSSGGTPYIDRGPGIAANDSGVIYLAIFEDSVSDAKFMMGLGASTWDSAPATIGNGHRGEIDSGTSIVHVQGQKWLVAYNHQNRAKVVKFDSSTSVRDFGAEVTPVLGGVVNNNIIDRPALVNRNGRLIVSWLMANQLQMVTGDIQAEEPVWQPGFMFSANVTEQGFGPPIGAHALAHDGQTFYAAVVRQRNPLPGETVSHYFLFLYTSNDGLHWSKLTSRESRNPQSMSVAARGTNNIIVILSSSIVLGPAIAYRFDGSNWTVLDNSAIFGTNPINAGHDFTLYVKD